MRFRYEALDFATLFRTINSLQKGKHFVNGIGVVECNDNKGRIVNLQINSQTRLRITSWDNSITIYFFDTVFIKEFNYNSFIIGRYSRASDNLIPIDIGDITKVEVMCF